MSQMKYKLCSLAIVMAGAFASATCSVDGGDSYSSEAAADKSLVSSTSYVGAWQFITNGSVPPQGQATNMKSACIFEASRRQLTIATMPTDLLLVLANLQGYEVATAMPYTMATEEKGYSQRSVIYGLTMPDYAFTARMDGQVRRVRVSFKGYSELVVDTYLNNITVMTDIEAVYVDDGQAYGEAGTLMYKAERTDY